MNHVLAIASDYQTRGFNVIPMRRDDRKVPALSHWKPYQTRRVSFDELQQWFRYGGGGIAAVCGRISGGLVVVDIDDETLAARFLDGNPGLLESTLCARSGGGNLHVYVRTPFPPRKFSLLKRTPPVPIDIQAEGGYIVMPPSPHPSGRHYQWLVGCGSEPRLVQEFDLWFQRSLARAGVHWMPDAKTSKMAPYQPGRDAVGAIITLFRELSGADGERRGREVWWRCPFHHDEVASLSANIERPVWHCFGCGEGGGIRRLRELQRGR